MIKKILYTLVIIASSYSVGQAQDFKSAIGVRLGQPLAVSYKTFINEKSAIEAYVGYRNFGSIVNFLSINGAYQVHKDIESVEGLGWYVGGGASAYFWGGNFVEIKTTFGVSGYLGLNYNIKDTPINITVDWVPTVFFSGNLGFGTGFGAGYGAVAARYILN